MLAATVLLAPIPLGFLGYACGRRVRGGTGTCLAAGAIVTATLGPAAWLAAAETVDPAAFYALTSVVVLTVPALLGLAVGVVSAREDAGASREEPDRTPSQPDRRKPAADRYESYAEPVALALKPDSFAPGPAAVMEAPLLP